MMYYVGKDGSEKRLVLYTNEEKNKAFEECHVLHKSGEHCGESWCFAGKNFVKNSWKLFLPCS